ncbi:MAG: dicarboxylate/amino acid:cation symporter [bacterium]
MKNTKQVKKKKSSLKEIMKNYKSTIILLSSILIGALIGYIFKEDAIILKPLGTLLLNFLLLSVIPLIFFSITSSIVKMDKVQRLGKILRSILVVFVATSVISILGSFAILKNIDLVESADAEIIKESFDYTLEDEGIELNLLERTVSVISVNDFQKVLTTDNVLALIIVAILVGISVNKAGKKGEKIKELLISANEVTTEFIGLIMLYAPIGLLAYFAALVGEMGSIISVGYLKTAVVYLLVAMIFYFVVYTLYAYIAAGKKGVKCFWQNITYSSATALGTCSSAASVPVNIECTKKIGVPSDIAETTISFGTSFHKDGSSIGNVVKIMFLASLFGMEISGFKGTMEVIGISLLSMILVSAVPIGGGTIAEMIIITMMGFPVAALPILTIVAVVIDAPATLLNVVGDSSSSMLVARLAEGKDWLKDKKN